MAVGLVVLCHARVRGLEGGYIGVDVFFVLSGFLITGLLIRERASTGSASLVGFYARRARRILPAASIVLVATVLASYEWLGPLRGATIAQDGKWTAVFAANLHFASEDTQYLNVAAPPSPLQHYWSLAVEEQFYLVWPLVFLAVTSVAPRVNLKRKLAPVLLLVIVASFAWSAVQTNTNVTWAFFSPLTRAWELAVGALLAVSLAQIHQIPRAFAAWLSWSGLAAIGASALLLDGGTLFPGYAAALPVFGTAMVVAGGSIAPRAGAERLLGFLPFQVLGKWSYALYLWHWPILIIAEQRAGHELALLENLGLVGCALALAALTHYIVENPVRYASPLVRNRWASLSAGACLVVAGFGLCQWQLQNGVPETRIVPAHEIDVMQLPDSTAADVDPVAEVLALVSASPAISSLPDDVMPDLQRAVMDFAWLPPWGRGCLVDWDVVASPPCVFGDPNGSRTVAVLGDSHAAMWMGSLDEIGRRQHWKVIILTKTGCPAITLDLFRPVVFGRNTVTAAYGHCATWLTSAIARINQVAPDAVILASCNGCDSVVDSRGELISRSAWTAGLQETLRRVSPPNTVKVVLGDIPRWYGSLDCLALKPNEIQDCSKPTATVAGATYNADERAAADAERASFVDVAPWFCTAVCSPVVGNMVVYSNDSHLTATYALSLVGALESVLTPLVKGTGGVSANR